jgi:AraC family transcriptional regulator
VKCQQNKFTQVKGIATMTSNRILGRSQTDGTVAPIVWSEPVLSDARAKWSDMIKVEYYSISPCERPDFASIEHNIAIFLNRPATISLKIDGQRWQRSVIPPGHLHIASAGVSRSARLWEPAQFLLLALIPTFVSQVMKGSLYPDQVEFANHRAIADPLIREIGLSLMAELTRDDPSRLYAETLATSLTVHMSKTYGIRRPQLRNYDGGLQPGELARIVEYINTYLNQDLSLKTLANLVGMSVHHFARQFRTSTGVSPYAYVMQQRIEQARRLLQSTELTITEICHRVGYTSQSHFTRLFHRIVGTTPYSYRKQNRS